MKRQMGLVGRATIAISIFAAWMVLAQLSVHWGRDEAAMDKRDCSIRSATADSIKDGSYRPDPELYRICMETKRAESELAR